MIAKIHNLKSGKTVEREMTSEEIAAMEEAEANPPVSEPTAEERIAALEAAVLDMILTGGNA